MKRKAKLRLVHDSRSQKVAQSPGRAGICKFEHCDNPVKHTTLGICYRCYTYLLKWRDRAPGAKKERLGQIKSLNERMEYMLEGSAPMPKRKPKVKK